ncbi:streptavidin-V2-like [Oscarella lobularis]|uniref:streptavidin-V2-like n=1 Tax=Oscarella lobularis TaxID=121494 RepID=UPI0033144C8A
MFSALVFVSLVVCASTDVGPECLVGWWRNELGSCLSITVIDNGTLWGTYNSKVGEAINEYPLVGRYDTRTDPDLLLYGRPLGWTVVWKNLDFPDSYSTTSWSALYYTSPEELIHSTWLLTTSKEYTDVWSSTQIGQDVFVKDSTCAPP